MTKNKVSKKSNQSNLINHISFVLDASGSIENRGLTRSLLEVFDNQIASLKQRSQQLNQETRISVYTFANDVECLAYDVDINRLPNIARSYKPNGNTCLIDGTLQAIDDSEAISQKYGDHAFLFIVLTDGEENYSDNSVFKLSSKLKSLNENFTVSILVPNQKGVFEAKNFGFPANNISVWETTSKGLQDTGVYLSSATDSYLIGRSVGIRATNQFFNVDTTKLKSSVVKKELEELSPREYTLVPVRQNSVIKDFVESWTSRPYRVGSAFYQLTKPEEVQSYKQILVEEKQTGKVYGGTNARDLLGLPDYSVKVSPTNFSKYAIYCQSSSTNRKLIAGTKAIILN